MIEFFDADGALGTIEYVDGELRADPILADVVEAWLAGDHAPEDFEEAYADWSNGYVKSRLVELDDESDTLIADAATFHLPDRHNQKTHGRRKSNSGDSPSTAESSDKTQAEQRRAAFDDRLASAYVDDDVFTKGSRYSSLDALATAYEDSRSDNDPPTSRVTGAYGMYQVSYADINTELRSGDIDEFNARVIGYMDVGFEHSDVTSDVIVHRGISDPKIMFGEAWNAEGDNTGLTWEDPAYMSTTTSQTVARSYATNDLIRKDGVMMRMLVKSGTPAIPMRGNLSQLLLGKGRKSTIVRDYVNKDGYRALDVEVS